MRYVFIGIGILCISLIIFAEVYVPTVNGVTQEMIDTLKNSVEREIIVTNCYDERGEKLWGAWTKGGKIIGEIPRVSGLTLNDMKNPEYARRVKEWYDEM